MSGKNISFVLFSQRGAGVVHLVQPPGEDWQIRFYEWSIGWSAVWPPEKRFNSPDDALSFVRRQIRRGILPVGFDGYFGQNLQRVPV
jgi:hypothetical protein